jgi:hypothetical protein
VAKKGRLKNLGVSFQEKLLKRYFVRWHMSLILMATVASGLLVDKALLHLGLGTMSWRYAISVLAAYGFFFLAVRMWIWYAAGVAVTISLPDLNGTGDIGIPDVPIGGKGIGYGPGFSGFSGGDSGGGGASDLFDAPAISSGGGGGGGGGGSSFDFSLDLDEGFWILLVLAVVVIVVAMAGGYLIWMAPEILPDVALECAIGAGLVKQLKDQDAGWAGRLLWKTWIPLVIVMIVAAFAGSFIQDMCPGATTVRAALHCAATQ